MYLKCQKKSGFIFCVDKNTFKTSLHVLFALFFFHFTNLQNIFFSLQNAVNFLNLVRKMLFCKSFLSKKHNFRRVIDQKSESQLLFFLKKEQNNFLHFPHNRLL